MLYGADTIANTAQNCFSRVGVRHDIRTSGCGFLHRRADFLVRELIHPQRVRRRQDATGNEQLDLRRALSKLFADGPAHLIGSVHDCAECATIAARANRHGVGRAHVAMPACLRERFAGHQKPGSSDQTLFACADQADISAAGVTHCRESS